MSSVGTHSPELAQMLLQQLVSASEINSRQAEDDINGLLAFLQEMHVEDPVEAMLVCQMVACNQQAVKMLQQSRQEMHADSTEQWLKIANRLMALFVKQTEALAKYKRKGHQSMQVEHLYINNDNGQAVIGSINSSR